MITEYFDPGDAAGLLAEKEEVPQLEAAGGDKRHHLQEAEPGAGTQAEVLPAAGEKDSTKDGGEGLQQLEQAAEHIGEQVEGEGERGAGGAGGHTAAAGAVHPLHRGSVGEAEPGEREAEKGPARGVHLVPEGEALPNKVTPIQFSKRLHELWLMIIS